MSRRVPSEGSRTRGFLPIAAIVAILAAPCLAGAGTPVKPVGPATNGAKSLARGEVDDTAVLSTDRATATAVAGGTAVPNDTCAGAIPLTLNVVTKGTTVDASDDYQTPATTACYAGIGQFPTTAPGRDVVYSFTAPAAGKYSFVIISQDPNGAIGLQNEVLFLTDCANEGTVTCIEGANRGVSPLFTSSKGSNNGVGEEISCHPMTSGQTVYVVFDDGQSGTCSNNGHACFADSDCASGATCNPQLNPGGDIGLEVKDCVATEAEPNDTPGTANAYVCGINAQSAVAPVAHCYLGPRAGNVCTRSGFLSQALPDSNMRCSVSGAQCVVDVSLGTSDCPVGELCQQQTDLDCDPRCDIGPNAGKSCTTQGFCNPVSDQGATCAGSCQPESTCIVDATGVDTGVACTPVCVGSSNPAVNGRYCSALSGCPGAGICTVTPNPPTLGATCLAGQTCGRQFNEGDTDYFSLGSPPAGSKVFVAVDGARGNDFDWRMRVTTATDTLQFDDDDQVSQHGQNAPVIAGAVTDGSPTYVQVSRTGARQSAPYEVYAIVRPPLAAAQTEDESGPFGNNITFYWPGDVIVANPVDAGGYVKGALDFAGDTDCFRFLVNKGDLMDWFGDGGPGRGTGSVATVNNPWPIIYDAEPAGIQNFVFTINGKKNTAANVHGPGLRALSPAVTSSYLQWRASYTGMLEICYYDVRNFFPTIGPQTYPNDWAGSLSVNCGPVQNAGPGTTTADVSIAKTAPAGPLQTGQIFDYTITVTNNGTEIAQSVDIYDTLDPNLTFVTLTVDDTLGGGNTGCFSLPTPGQNDAPIDCINASMAPGSTTVYTLTVQVNNCIGGGVEIENTVSIFTESTDPNPNNDVATASFTTVAQAGNGCTDIVCDGATCTADLCTTNNVCVDDVCSAGEAANCDDNSLCTDDYCDSTVGCVNDSTQAGDLCDDFVECTTNACDPIEFCVFPPKAAGTSCDDGLDCTNTDQCDGSGVCAGAVICDDDDVCTADTCDLSSACLTSPTNIDTTGFSADRVDGRDLVILADAWNSCTGGPADLDQNGCVGLDDFHLFMNSFGWSCP